MPCSESEHVSIDQARGGDRQALERLLLTHGAMISSHIERRFPTVIRDLVGPEDILQQTLLHAYLGIDTLKECSREAFIAWIKTIADMRLVDALRVQQRQKRGGKLHRRRLGRDSVTGSLVDLADELADDSPTASSVMARDEAVLAIQVAIAGLPKEQREAVRLHVLEGKSLKDTAAEMDRTMGAIRGLVHRGKQQLAEAMGRASMWLSAR